MYVCMYVEYFFNYYFYKLLVYIMYIYTYITFTNILTNFCTIWKSIFFPSLCFSQERTLNPFPLESAVPLNNDYSARFYIRIKCSDGLGIIRAVGQAAEVFFNKSYHVCMYLYCIYVCGYIGGMAISLCLYVCMCICMYVCTVCY